MKDETKDMIRLQLGLLKQTLKDENVAIAIMIDKKTMKNRNYASLIMKNTNKAHMMDLQSI